MSLICKIQGRSKFLEKLKEDGIRGTMASGHVFIGTGVRVPLWPPGRSGTREGRKFLLMVCFNFSMKNEVPSWANMRVGGG